MRGLKILFLTGVILINASVPAWALKVTTSVLPMWVLAQNVAGDRIDISLLVTPGTDIHEFSLSPRDVKTLQEADLIIINGLGLESFSESLPKKVRVVEAAAQVQIKKHTDPHVWLDPFFAKIQVNTISSALAEADPEGWDMYVRNVKRYTGKLANLHKEISDILSPFEGEYLITYHESFTYFAERYGLRSFSLTGSHAEQPMPQRVKQAYDIIKIEDLKAVFVEEQYPPEVMKRLTEDLGVTVCRLSTLTTGKKDAGLYERVMIENAKTIARCLGKGTK